MLVAQGAALRRDFAFAPENIFTLNFPGAGIQRARNDSTTQNVVPIRDNKAAHGWDAIVIVENKRRPGLESYFACFVDAKLVAVVSRLIECPRVDHVSKSYDLALDVLS